MNVIREYIDTDLTELLDVWYQSTVIAHPFMTENFLAKEYTNIRDIYIPNTETWVYLNEKGLHGFISMIGNEVGAIFVRPEMQGLGIGKLLMDHVCQYHDSLEVEVFKVNKIGRAFYDKYGFKKIRESIHTETQQKLYRMKFIVQ